MKHITLITALFLVSLSCSKPTPPPVVVVPPTPQQTSRVSINGDVLTFNGTEEIDYTSTASGKVAFALKAGDAKEGDVLTLITPVNGVDRITCNADGKACSNTYQNTPEPHRMIITIKYGIGCKYQITYGSL